MHDFVSFNTFPGGQVHIGPEGVAEQLWEQPMFCAEQVSIAVYKQKIKEH